MTLLGVVHRSAPSGRALAEAGRLADSALAEMVWVHQRSTHHGDYGPATSLPGGAQHAQSLVVR